MGGEMNNIPDPAWKETGPPCLSADDYFYCDKCRHDCYIGDRTDVKVGKHWQEWCVECATNAGKENDDD